MGVMKDFDRRIRQGGDDAIAAVGELMPRWIPVAERLPEERVPVLTYGDDPVEGPFTLIGLRVPESKFCPADWHLPGFSDFGPVTHWMPLPAPPEVT